MISKADASTMLFQTIGWPIGAGIHTPEPALLEDLTEFAFKSRVGLLFLDECVKRGVPLGPKALDLHRSLTRRRSETDRVIVKLADRLDEVAQGDWVLFKSIKPFASTPNDSDWFPLDPDRHGELCAHLEASGDFKIMEVAPLQTTMIEAAGAGVTDTTKRGGIYYVDCYIYPSTDFFIYLDPRRLRKHVTSAEVAGRQVPVLQPHAELTALMFHNVFPERSFSVESYYLVKRYLDLMEEAGTLTQFVDVCREQKVEFAAAANLVVTRDIDLGQFGTVDPRIEKLLELLDRSDLKVRGFDPKGAFPYEFPNKVFWGAFLSKQRDRTSFHSSLNQARHMLNPVFFADVVKIIWKRSVRGGVYEQN